LKELVLLAIVVALFWPLYDLDVAKDVDWQEHRIVETDFLTLGACREAARQYRAADWVCWKKTGWGQLANDGSKYDSKHR
jgi:hypothetical protein